MTDYTHVLLATDLSERALRLGEHAVHLAKLYGARISFVHIVQENDMGAGMEVAPPIPGETDAGLVAIMHHRLTALAESLGESDAECWVVTSNAVGKQIRHVAEEHGIDLIVVGSHGRHGLALLLGQSTPNQVLHGAQCDVLAVHIPR